jgi:hypothetical protein
MLTTQRSPQVTLYGHGSPGGKGAGLITIDECTLARTAKLPTHILATDFYDRYLDQGRALGPEVSAVATSMLEKLGDVPIGVRSSATNEAAARGSTAWAIHAGENLTFMLPNNHPDASVRHDQVLSAVRHIYDHFFAAQAGSDQEKMAIVINPIPGLLDDTAAGPVFYPYVSGVANSFFPYALQSQDPAEGYARIAFGHGYATVLDDFPVISMATIRKPIPIAVLRPGGGQKYFFALDLTRNQHLSGDELETMKTLHVRLANFHKIRLLGVQQHVITIEELIQKDQFGFKTGLEAVMDGIGARIAGPFQIEFVFNVDFKTKPYRDGVFHVVQLTLLPNITYDPLEVPDRPLHQYVSIANCQGHGKKGPVKYAVVVSPGCYSKDRHDEVRAGLAAINRTMRQRGDDYLVIVPGRLGSRNRDWGIFAEYKDIDQAAAIFEYGVDIAGRAQPLPEEDSLTGGTYGSHFLYMVLGGHSEDQRRMQTRMFGTQGTHFFTNIMSNNKIYGYISPVDDTVDPWFFRAPSAGEALYVLTFPAPATIYADSRKQRCVVVSEGG